MAERQSVGFVGGGRITRCLIGGWARAAAVPETVVVADPDGAAVDRLRSLSDRVRPGTLEDAARAGVVVVAVHPPVVREVLGGIAGAAARGTIVLSLVPKVTVAQLAGALDAERIARMIPNAASIVGRGYNPVFFGAGLGGADRGTLRTLFEPWGTCPEVPEETLEAYAIISAMGPTYFWPQYQALRELGAKLGLAPGAAGGAVHATLEGTAATLFESGLSSQEVMDLVPVQPLSEEVDALVAAYDARLTALHAKLKPAP